MILTEKPRVLIDVDGVLRDFIGSLINVYLRENPGHSVKTVDSRSLEDFFPIGREMYPFMNETFAREILEAAPVYPEAVEALRKWESAFDIVIVTAQPPRGRFPTLTWLGNHQVPTNEIHMTGAKHRLEGIALLDDFVDNLENFAATGRQAVCLDQPWNKDWQGPRVKTVDDFFRLLQSR